MKKQRYILIIFFVLHALPGFSKKNKSKEPKLEVVLAEEWQELLPGAYQIRKGDQIDSIIWGPTEDKSLSQHAATDYCCEKNNTGDCSAMHYSEKIQLPIRLPTAREVLQFSQLAGSSIEEVNEEGGCPEQYKQIKSVVGNKLDTFCFQSKGYNYWQSNVSAQMNLPGTFGDKKFWTLSAIEEKGRRELAYHYDDAYNDVYEAQRTDDFTFSKEYIKNHPDNPTHNGVVKCVLDPKAEQESI